MRDRIGTPTGVIIRQYEPQICTGCGGTKGTTETTVSADGTTVTQSWRPCGSCNGTGVR